MKVLQLCESFGGGNFSSVTQICNGLASRGHEVHLGYSQRAETPKNFAASLHPDIVLHELKMTREIAPWTDLRSLFTVMALIRRIQPQVIHLHSSKAGFIGRSAGFLLGRNRSLFYSPRGLSFLQSNVPHNKRTAYRWLEWMAARLGGTLIACSQSELNEAQKHIAPHRAILIENSVDVTLVPPRKPVGNEILRVGILGRISAQRNPEMFIRLARRLASPNVKFIWIGGGEDAAHKALEDVGVRVTGWLPRSEGLAELASLDIYLHTSLWEGMPVAVIEAQVAGLPAVVTDVIGNRDVVLPSETGFVCADEQSLVASLEALIASPDLRARMGAQARELGLVRFPR